MSKNTDILIFENMEYQFMFYDANFGTLRSLIGLVTNVYEDQIKIKYVQNRNTDTLNCACCDKKNICKKSNDPTNQPPMPTCNCILNPPDVSKYDEPQTYFIPIRNLVSVKYIKSDQPPKPDKKEGVKVVLLGISATMVKSIIIRLDFFDDSIEDAVKYVEMQAGSIYDIAFEEKGTTYESRVKVIKIEEITDGCPCQPDNSIVREYVGMDNSVYHVCCKKDDFMQQPPVKRVRITVDTSEDFSGRYEAIMLDSIRDCTLVANPDGSEPTIPDNPTTSCCDGCIYKTETCDHTTCGHYIPPKPSCDCSTSSTYSYDYGNATKAKVEGEKVTLSINGEKSEIDLNTLLKYYLGVD